MLKVQPLIMYFVLVTLYSLLMKSDQYGHYFVFKSLFGQYVFLFFGYSIVFM